MTTDNTNNIHVYQALSLPSERSMYDQVDRSALSDNVRSSAELSEYDQIKEKIPSPSIQLVQYAVVNQDGPPITDDSMISTTNSLYASRDGSLLQHPTLLNNRHHQMSPIPEATIKEVSDHTICKCSVEILICLLALLTIFLSTVAIVVVGLLWGGILSNPIHAVSQDDLMTLNPQNQTFSDDAIFNLTFNETIDNTSSCDCSTSLDDYYIDFNYTEIYEVFSNSIFNLSDTFDDFKFNKMMSDVDINQRLYKLISLIKAINESIQRLVSQANTLSFNIPASYNLSGTCVTKTMSLCTITSFYPGCFHGFFDHTLEGSMKLVSAACRLESSETSSEELIQGMATVANVTDEQSNHYYYSCSCYSLQPASCHYTAVYCPETATLSPHN